MRINWNNLRLSGLEWCCLGRDLFKNKDSNDRKCTVLLACGFLFVDQPYRPDAMNVARGFQVVLTPFIPARYTAHLLFTHIRGLIPQNKGSALLWHRTYIFISPGSPHGHMWYVLMIFVWQKEPGGRVDGCNGLKMYMGKGKRQHEKWKAIKEQL